MNKKIIVAAATALTLAAPLASFADEGAMRGRLGVSNNSFTTIWSGGDLETSYNSLNFGFTYITPKSYYYDLAIKKSLSASWNTVELTDGTNDGRDEDYARNDLTFTVGKVLDNGVQVFAGYQDSSATIALPPISWVQDLGSVVEEEIDVSGFFLGAGKSIKLGEGSLNLNAAYGSMSATLVDAGGIANDSSGGNGYSIGATYTHFFTDDLSVNFELKQQKYSYDFSSPDIALTSGDDKMTMIGFNVVRQF